MKQRPKGRPRGKKNVETTQAPRPTIINLKGSLEQAEWLETVHRKTHIAKSVIVRLALIDWAAKNGYEPFPTLEDE